MASIENRSRFKVTVPKRPELTKTFPYSSTKAVKKYVEALQAQGHRPTLSRLNDSFAVRVRQAGYPEQCIFENSEEDAIATQQRLESERHRGLFIDYGKARRVTFADLLARYLREEAPRHKGFLVEGYIINGILEDAGLPRVDVAQAYAEHKNPHPKLAGIHFPKPSGRKMRTTSAASAFVRKSFADLLPTDFNDYIDDRCQYVNGATVDRAVDLMAATCRLAIDTWRIAVAQNPMDGVRRPKYFNERDRRLKGDEEDRLLAAARAEDARQAVERRLEELIAGERVASLKAKSVYERKAIIKEARARNAAEAARTAVHVPMLETFIRFQLMTAARRSESLGLHWNDIDFEAQTAFIAETKNGRPRNLPLRSDLLLLLGQLPRTGNLVFPLTVDSLRSAWERICEAAGLVGVDELHIHDLRHEAISRVAEAGGRLPGGFSLVELQAFSGHRDIRMLLRYTHLCMPSLAKRLDEAFADEKQTHLHRGQRRLKEGASLSIAELVGAGHLGATFVQPSIEAPSQAQSLGSNVVPFPSRKAR